MATKYVKDEHIIRIAALGKDAASNFISVAIEEKLERMKSQSTHAAGNRSPVVPP